MLLLSFATPKVGERARVAMTEASGPSITPTAELQGAQASTALIEALREEYNSFFDPMLHELYVPDVTFQDPLIELNGVDAYEANVRMLAGNNIFGKLCFCDCGLEMHAASQPTPETLMTRWTLQFRFRLLPWAPLARFTGVSKYRLSPDGRIASQRDFWDSINLQPGGEYAATGKGAALADFLGQLAPLAGSAGSGNSLLRRAKDYEVRKYHGREEGEVIAVVPLAVDGKGSTVPKLLLDSTSELLVASLRRDRLLEEGADGTGEQASLSPDGTEVWLPLKKHPWVWA